MVVLMTGPQQQNTARRAESAPGRIPGCLPVLTSPAPDAHAEGAGAFFEGGAG